MRWVDWISFIHLLCVKLNFSDMKKLVFSSILLFPLISSFGQHGMQAQGVYLETRPEYVEIPFFIQERDLFVQATVNGKKGNYHWDTGAPLIILNTSAHDQDAITSNGDLKHGVSGATGSISNISKLSLESVAIGGLQGNNVPALGMDFSHFSVPSMGLIGAKVMEGYLTFFDLKDQVIEMYRTDSDGNIPDPSLLNGYDQVEVRKYGHLPIIEVEISGRKFNMALDSGCSTMMINPEYKDVLKDSYVTGEMDTLRGGGKEELVLESYQFQKLSFANHSFENVKCFFKVGIESQNPNLKIDGIIGWDIFWHSLLAFNLDQNLIYIKKN